MRTLEVAEKIVLARANLVGLEAEYRQLLSEGGAWSPKILPPTSASVKIPAAVLDDGVRFPTTTEQKSTVAHRVRRFLATHEDGASFSDIWEMVKKGGGTKFGVRSTLQKDRAKGVVTFDGSRYKLAPVKK